MRQLFPLLVLSLLLSSNAAVAEKAAERGVNSERLMLAGDRPDPSIIRDGDTYYMVHSSFEYAPGLLIYRSKDLVRWEPLVNALHRYVGSVYAPDIVKHNGRWYIYFPVVTPAHTTNMSYGPTPRKGRGANRSTCRSAGSIRDTRSMRRETATC